VDYFFITYFPTTQQQLNDAAQSTQSASV